MAATRFPEAVRRLLPGIWFGLLAAIAFIATPAAFQQLQRADAGTLARAIFAIESPVSLAFGVVLLMAERRAGVARHEASGRSQFTAGMMLALGALFCTVAGYYALQPMMEAARAAGPDGAANFGRLHAISTAFFGVKGLLVLALAWRALR